MCILLALLLAVNFCHGDDSKTVEVVGSAEFALSNIKPSEAFSGILFFSLNGCIMVLCLCLNGS